MPIEALAQIIGNVTMDANIATMTFLNLKKDNSKTLKERIEDSHKEVIEFMNEYSKVHEEYMKKRMAEQSGKIQTVASNSEFAQKIMSSK